MTRKKNQKRFNQQKNLSKNNDKSPSSSNSPDTEMQKFLINSAGRTPVKTPNHLFCESKIENALKQQTPKDLINAFFEINELDGLFSPKLGSRIPRLKLDFDVPENDSDEEDFVVNTRRKEAVEKQLSDEKKYFSRKIFEKENNFENENNDHKTFETQVAEELTKSETKNVNSNFSQIKTSQFESKKFKSSQILPNDKISKIESAIKISECESGYDSNSPSNKKSYTLLDKKDQIINSVAATEVKIVDNIDENQIPTDYVEKFSETIITLPQKKYNNNTATLKSQCVLFKRSMSIFKQIKISFPKVNRVCWWITRKIGAFVNQIFTQIPKILMPGLVSQSKLAPVEGNDCNQVLLAVRCENEKILTLLSKQVTHFSEEIKQVRATSEMATKALTREIISIRDTNEKLVENTSVLVEELKSLHKTLTNMQFITKNSVQAHQPLMLNLSTMTPPTLTPSLTPAISSKPSLPPPPPPPPLPPSPFLRQNAKTPTTPKSSRIFKKKTPAKKSSSTSVRPSITVEDLLKVTLKKAPNCSKETRRNSFPVQKGPVVSLDMLRSVKLRSSRSRHGDSTKSPRSRSAIQKSRLNSSLKMSPASARSEDPLDRILKEVDLNRPQRRKSFTCPSPNNNDTLETTSTCKTRKPSRFLNERET